MSGTLLSLLDGLFGASWRGVDFHVPDTSHEIGRRTMRHWFPGRDDTVFQDLGGFDGPIEIRALVIGDDYVARMRLLEKALYKPGPGILVHPWLGELKVVLTRPARVSYSERELRVARVEMSFERWSPPFSGPVDFLTAVQDLIQEIRAEIRSTLAAVLAPVRLAVAVVSAVSSFVTSAIGTVRGVIVGITGIGSGLDLAIASMTGSLGLAADDDYGPGIADALGAAPLALAAGAAPALTPAIGAAADSTSGTVVLDPAQVALSLLTLGDALEASSSSVPALPVVAALQARLAAVEAAANITHASNVEALAWRDRLAAALEVSSASAARLTESWPDQGYALWSGINNLLAALMADYTAIIGRLPSVETLPPRAGTVSAWLIAQHLAGDDPSTVVAMMDDLMARNGITHPALVPAEQLLEYLA